MTMTTATADARHTHFTGIGGIHMSALAHILLDDGERVSGCDRADSRLLAALRGRGVEIDLAHDPRHAAMADRVVRTVAVPAEHPEIAAAEAAGTPVLTRAELLREVAAGRRVIAVSGSHGKSTTTAMAAMALRAGGRDAGYVLGAEAAEFAPHARRGSDEWMALEADEYGRAFHHYEPEVAVITNVEPDHLDYYGDFAALREAFAVYARTLRPGGALVFDASSADAAGVAAEIARERPDLRIARTALGSDGIAADWIAPRVLETAEATRFSVEGPPGRSCAELRVPGDFNVRNALLALAAADCAGFAFEDALRGVAAFSGIRRRFQPHGPEAAGVAVLDDYAHHPTEIAATVRAARARYRGRRLLVVFQPHTYSRSRYLLDGFRTAFRGADRLLIADTYAARETPEQGLAADGLAAEIREPAAEYAGSVGEAAAAAAAGATAGDVIITMGAGDVDSAGPEILRRLRERSP